MTRGLVVALTLPPLVTAVVLVLAARNRSGALEPLVLSERELSLPPQSDDNSVARMLLRWQQRMSREGGFDCAKLQTVGMPCEIPPTDPDAPRHYGRMLPRPVFVAFELGGPAWEALIAERTTELNAIGRDLRERGSRLVAIDVDSDAAVLRRRYPDSSRYLITAAVVRPLLILPENEPPYIIGTVDRVDPRELHVPTELATQLPPAKAAPDRDERPRYRVSVRYGRRLEPWIVAIGR